MSTPTPELPPRIVCQFSCGAASAVATKLALAQYGDQVTIINADIENEDKDNRRFLADCERWFGREIVVLRDQKYGANINNVFRQNLAWPDRPIVTPLIERGLKKRDCKAMVMRAGIVLPLQYRRGYKNANCKVCIKGGEKYMRAARVDHPEEFEEVCKSEDIVADLHGDNARLLRYRSGPLKGKRYALRDLSHDGPMDRADAPPECGLLCESAEQEYAA